MKIYTKTGDDGTTGLFGGGRVRKSDARIQAYGTVDELNASLGLARTAAQSASTQSHIATALLRVQHQLFVIGSHLATPEDSPYTQSLPLLEESMIGQLEMEIDEAEARLPPLKNFILPGGGELASRLHLARTICRRSERILVDFAMDRPIHTTIITYLNRLSDWLFVMARQANQNAQIADIPWEK